MRLVVQRVTSAAVTVAGDEVAAIRRGALVLAGIGAGDDLDVVRRMAHKLAGLRYFPDSEGKTNDTIAQAGGAFLVVSQFTVMAELRRGRRPSFGAAAAPELASALFDAFVATLRSVGHRVEVGQFGARMSVSLVNDGPFTLVLDSERDLAD